MRNLTLLTLLLLLSGCYVGIIDPTPSPEPTITFWPTNTHSPTPEPTHTLTAVNISPTDEDATPTMEATFTACVSGSYAVAYWKDFTLYEWPNLTHPIQDISADVISGYYPYQGEWYPIVTVLLLRQDATYGTWEVCTGLGEEICGFVDRGILTGDCQY